MASGGSCFVPFEDASKEKKERKAVTHTLSDSDDGMDSGSNSDGGDVEEDSKRKANLMVSAMLASIQATAKSPEDDSKVQSSRGGKRGKRGGVGEISEGTVKSKKAMDLLNSLDAKKAERQRRERIRELEARQNAKDEEEVVHIALPTIMTASEREAAKNKSKRTSIETIDLLASELGVSDDIVPPCSISKTKPSSDTDDDGEDGSQGLQIKTRLNGSHLATMFLPHGAHFDELVKRLAAFYGLSKHKSFKADKLRLEFDGETLDTSTTPEDVDMDDGDLIDVKLDEKLLRAAMEFVEKEAAMRKEEQVKASASKTAAAGVVKFKTLLNGQHEHKWMVKKHESFGSIMDKFATFYGLNGSDVEAFLFDGEKVGRDETPDSLDTQDGDLIRVRRKDPIREVAVFGSFVSTRDKEEQFR